jgi:large subunit ribosomal protein L30
VPKKIGIIHIKWVRSGIGFPRKQKEVVRSIGLHRLNQIIERPDTVHFRGLVAKVPHLVELVDAPSSAAWANTPEYKIIPAESSPKVPSPRAKKVMKAAPAEEIAATKSESSAPRKKAGSAKSVAAKSSVKGASAGTEKPKPKRKAAAPKSAAKAEPKSKKGKK